MFLISRKNDFPIAEGISLVHVVGIKKALAFYFKSNKTFYKINFKNLQSSHINYYVMQSSECNRCYSEINGFCSQNVNTCKVLHPPHTSQVAN